MRGQRRRTEACELLARSLAGRRFWALDGGTWWREVEASGLTGSPNGRLWRVSPVAVRPGEDPFTNRQQPLDRGGDNRS
jgi:hypothetical protein